MSTSDAVARIIDAGSLEAKFELSDRDYGRLFNATGGLLGRSAKVHWNIGTEQLTFNAVISRKGAKIDPATGGIQFFAKLALNDRITPLRPGAFVRIEIPDRNYSDVFRLPATAVENNKYIYLVEEERLIRTPIILVRRLGGDVLIRPRTSGRDLEGSSIVMRRFPEIGPGLRVEVR